jgi:hypothetical protein
MIYTRMVYMRMICTRLVLYKDGRYKLVYTRTVYTRLVSYRHGTRTITVCRLDRLDGRLVNFILVLIPIRSGPRRGMYSASVSSRIVSYRIISYRIQDASTSPLVARVVSSHFCSLLFLSFFPSTAAAPAWFLRLISYSKLGGLRSSPVQSSPVQSRFSAPSLFFPQRPVFVSILS